jgi:hypothetical protein
VLGLGACEGRFPRVVIGGHGATVDPTGVTAIAWRFQLALAWLAVGTALGSVVPAPQLGDTRCMSVMDFEFEGPVIEWRGPAPFYFVRIPEEESADIKFAAKGMEYWGQVPVAVRIGDTEFTTALFPKDGRYLIPLKDVVRKSAGIEVDQVLAVALNVGREAAE